MPSCILLKNISIFRPHYLLEGMLTIVLLCIIRPSQLVNYYCS